MYKNVIVKLPSQSYVNGLTTSNLGTPDYELLLKQHESYVEALKSCGVSVTCLQKSEEFPDSTFVEDAAVLTYEPGSRYKEWRNSRYRICVKGFL
ncbi:hypothetical protein LAV79_18410 [Peribacillus butanolivorans]|uniref:hypothetical protein n=1 Tax=Peribacillus butanolivorans TaxID=421767 RepID=UPI0030C948FF